MRLPQREAPVVRVGPEGQAPKDHWHWPHALPEDRIKAVQERIQVRWNRLNGVTLADTDRLHCVSGRTHVQSSGPRRRRRHDDLHRHTPHDRLYCTSWRLIFVSHRNPSVYVLPPVYCYTRTGTSCHPRKIHELCHARFLCTCPGSLPLVSPRSVLSVWNSGFPMCLALRRAQCARKAV